VGQSATFTASKRPHALEVSNWTLDGAAQGDPVSTKPFISDTPGIFEVGATSSTTPVLSDTARLNVLDVEFDEYNEMTDNYGWDDYSMTAGWKFKSVEVGGSDNVSAVVTPPEAYEVIAYQSTLPSCVSVAPDTASAEPLIAVTGVSKGYSTIISKAGDCELAKFKTYAYTKRKVNVSVTRVHEAGNASQPGWRCTVDINQAALNAILKKVFRQAVLEFEVIVLPARTVSFDVAPVDRMLDVSSFGSAELNAIKVACETAHDFNIFLVSLAAPSELNNHPRYPELAGMMELDQKFGFVFVSSPRAVAHELGHGLNLEHTFGPTWEQRTWNDAENIMSYSTGGWRLRFEQWEKIRKKK